MVGMAAFLTGICSVQASTVVYDDFQVVSENTVFTTPFEVTRAGTYKAELVDFEYPAAFDILSLGITQDLNPLGFRFDTGSFTFDVLSPGTLQAHLAAIPGAAGLGVYALQIMAIPIPDAAALLFSGLVGLVVVGRRERRNKMA
jgi:hypothetical protein